MSAITNSAFEREFGEGRVFINIPPSFVLFSIFMALVVIGMGLLLCCASFSEKYTVKGYLNTDKGMIHVFSNHQGVIMKQLVQQSQLVAKGDVLLQIDTSYEGLHAPYALAMRRKLQEKNQLLSQEIHIKRQQLAALQTLLHQKAISQQMFEQHKLALLAMCREKKQIEFELIQQKQATVYNVHSPTSGVVSTLLFHPGQSTLPNKPLLSLLPKNATLLVELFIPVRQAGFVKRNSLVMVRFDAYPYQRFGAIRAKLVSLGQSVLTDQDDEKPLRVREPYYKAMVVLDQTQQRLLKKAHWLRQGMTITAIIMGEKKKLWQWILDPVLSGMGELWT